MLKNLNLKLENVGCISSADMNLSKINIIGGINSSGKSTASKLLYTFLMANSKTRTNLADEQLIKQVLDLTMDLLTLSRSAWEDEDECEKASDELIELFKKFSGSENDRKFKINPKDLNPFELFKELKKVIDKHPNIKDTFKLVIDEKFNKTEKLLDVYNDPDEIVKSLMQQLIKSEFGKNINLLKKAEFKGLFNDEYFDIVYMIDQTEVDLSGWFSIDDVLYMDSFSSFDILSKSGVQNTIHSMDLRHRFKTNDESKEWADEIINEKIIIVENKIKQITGGTFISDDDTITYIKNDGIECLMKNTASGIKQIGLIQMLLSKRELKENSFLIIDEPEVNIHPEWQVRLAEILVLLAKELDIRLYINSHSPFLIEALSLYSKYYGLLDETRFFLSEESDEEGKYVFVPIAINQLKRIYDNLGSSYDILDELKLKMMD